MKVKICFGMCFLVLTFVFGCATDPRDPRAGHGLVEGVVVKVEHTQGGGGLLNNLGSGTLKTHVFFTDGRVITFHGTPPDQKSIVINKYNRIWFFNGPGYIMDIEVIDTIKTVKKN